MTKSKSKASAKKKTSYLRMAYQSGRPRKKTILSGRAGKLFDGTVVFLLLALGIGLLVV